MFTKPVELEDARLIGNRTSQSSAQQPPRDPKELRKEQLKAKGPQQKPNFLVPFFILTKCLTLSPALDEAVWELL